MQMMRMLYNRMTASCGWSQTTHTDSSVLVMLLCLPPADRTDIVVENELNSTYLFICKNYRSLTNIIYLKLVTVASTEVPDVGKINYASNSSSKYMYSCEAQYGLVD